MTIDPNNNSSPINKDFRLKQSLNRTSTMHLNANDSSKNPLYKVYNGNVKLFGL